MLEIDFLYKTLISIVEILKRQLLSLLDPITKVFNLNRLYRINGARFLSILATYGFIFDDRGDPLVLRATIEHVFGAVRRIWRHHNMEFPLIFNRASDENIC